MKTFKMIVVASAFVAIAVLSFAGLSFSEDEATPSTDNGAVMSNASTAAPAPAAEAPDAE